jgi:hypothetical protein
MNPERSIFFILFLKADESVRVTASLGRLFQALIIRTQKKYCLQSTREIGKASLRVWPRVMVTSDSVKKSFDDKQLKPCRILKQQIRSVCSLLSSNRSSPSLWHLSS